MKKSLIALAVLAAAGAASAQSSVTLYGRLDLGAKQVKKTTTTTTTTTSLAGAQHSKTTSRFGVKGVEDLGDGLKAGFDYEFKLNPDNTDSSAVSTTRTARVYLAGGFGTVAVGTFLNSMDAATGYGAGIGDLAGAVNPGTQSSIPTRSQNALAYSSPSFGGVQLSVGLTSESSKTTGSTATKAEGYLLGLSYAGGPVKVNASYGFARDDMTTGTSTAYSAKAKTAADLGTLFSTSTGAISTVTDNGGQVYTTNTLANAKAQGWGLGASYDLGFMRPYLMASGSTAKVVNAVTTTAGVTWAAGQAFKKTSGLEVGSQFPLGSFTPYVLYRGSKDKNGNGGVTAKRNGYELGTVYSLSKRSEVYGAYGANKTKSATGTTTEKSSGLALGLVHYF